MYCGLHCNSVGLIITRQIPCVVKLFVELKFVILQVWRSSILGETNSQNCVNPLICFLMFSFRFYNFILFPMLFFFVLLCFNCFSAVREINLTLTILTRTAFSSPRYVTLLTQTAILTSSLLHLRPAESDVSLFENIFLSHLLTKYLLSFTDFPIIITTYFHYS
jgi:hypothetical protein